MDIRQCFWGASGFFGGPVDFLGGQWIFWGASGFFGGPVDFLIHWPPGPVVATVQCQGLRTNGNIWLVGDFNAPHINWPLLEVTPLAGTKRQIYQRLIDISLHRNIEQVIDKPTRGDNILDLFLTNNKSALQNFETLPPIGKADHDIVYIEINARPNRQNTPHHNVFIYWNANWDAIKSKLSILLDDMQSSTEQTSVNTQWTIFKTTLLNAMQEFIPQKQIKPKHCLPWVTE